MAARFVLRPETLEVVVASNLFADILSDLGGALAGSLGVAASANLDPQRRRPSMFEPVHGSALDIAGKGIANPIGALASAALMLEHLGLEEEAGRANRAIEATTGSGTLTPDLGGTSTTREVGDAVMAHLSRGPSQRREPPRVALGGPELLESRPFSLSLFTGVLRETV